MVLTLPLLRSTRETASPNMEQGLEHVASHPRCRAWDPTPLGERIGWSDLDWAGSSGCHTRMTHPFRGVTCWVGLGCQANKAGKQDRGWTAGAQHSWQHGKPRSCPGVPSLEALFGSGLGSTWLPHSRGQVTNLADLNLCIFCRVGLRTYLAAVSEQRAQ